MGAVSRVYLRVTRMVPSYRQAFIFRLGVSGYDHGTGTTATLWRRVNDKRPSAPRQIGQVVRYLGVMQSDSCIAARYQDFSAAISPNPAAVRLIRHTAGRYLSIHCNREMNPAGVRPINHTPRRYPSQSCRRTPPTRLSCDWRITPRADTRRHRHADRLSDAGYAGAAAIPHSLAAGAPKSGAPMSPAFPFLRHLPDIPYSSPPVGIRVSRPLTSCESGHIECCVHRNTGESTTTRPVSLRDSAHRDSYRVACPSTIATIRKPVI